MFLLFVSIKHQNLIPKSYSNIILTKLHKIVKLLKMQYQFSTMLIFPRLTKNA